MPQLDSTTFLAQFFWLTLVFLFLYVFTLKNILPQISYILKVRRKRLELNQSQLGNLKDEEESIIKKFDAIYTDSMVGSRQLLTKAVEDTNAWHNNSLQQINSTTLLELNEEYVATLSNMSGILNVMFRDDVEVQDEA